MMLRAAMLIALFLCVSSPAFACGSEGQRACCAGEASFGACKSGLTEIPKANSGKCGGLNPMGIQSSGVCVRVTACGGEGQRACCAGEASFGACKGGLSERAQPNSGYCGGGMLGSQSNGVCEVTETCGTNGSRPCRITEAFPSCRDGLAENFATDTCEPEKDLLASTCQEAIRLVRSQAEGAGDDLHADFESVQARIASNPAEQRAIEEATRQLTARFDAELRMLTAAVKEYAEPAHSAARGARDEEFCTGGSDKAIELRRILETHAKGMIDRGAFALSAAVETNAIVGLQATGGPVFGYDTAGSEQLGLQVSVQAQLITDVDVAGGAQLGWFPGARIGLENSLAGVVGTPRDGLLSGPYLGVHLGVSPEFLVEAEVAVDFLFELPSDLDTPITVQSLLDTFGGITVTVTAGLSALPTQVNAGMSIGNTFTAGLAEFGGLPPESQPKPAPQPSIRQPGRTLKRR